MRKLYISALVAAALSLPGLTEAKVQTIRMTCGPTEADQTLCEYVTKRFESETGHKVESVDWSVNATDQLGLLQQMFSAGDSTIDVMQLDGTWPGLIGNHLLDLSDHFSNEDGQFFEAQWKNNTVNGQIKAIPAWLSAAMLYYRTDLLEKYNEEPPETWDDMERIAKRIQAAEQKEGNRQFWGFVFQGKAYEGLTANALEWVYSHNGGAVVEQDGTISINNEGAARSFNRAAGWVGNIAPNGVLGYTEEEARALFQNGDALFLRNWPYVWNNVQADGSPVQGKVGISVLPRDGEDGQHAATLGGWQFGVNAYTENPELSVKLVDILTDKETQKYRFILTGYTPSIPSLYEDADILAIAPHMETYLSIFSTAVARPSSATTRHYNRVSNAFYNSAFNVLSGRMNGEDAVVRLERELQRIKGRGW